MRNTAPSALQNREGVVYMPSTMLKNAFRAQKQLFSYADSFFEASGTAVAMVNDGSKKLLAVSGNGAHAFHGKDCDGVRFCELSVQNAKALHALLPFTKPVSHKGHPFTIGLGDRLGIATPGHIKAISGYDAFPVLAQQSIRELTLTGRTFEEVIAAASFGVLQVGYTGGYGADGDHLKTREEIKMALDCGCTMITLDCSNNIDAAIANACDEEIDTLYAALPASVKTHYENNYVGKEFPVIGEISFKQFKRTVLVFYKAITHTVDCFRFIESVKTHDVDFELSVDETLSITTPVEHFVIANELHLHGITPVSVAPHFSGEFEKGIEYVGDLNAFARDYAAHQQIADHFGYKLSLHSGSDKFSVFSAVGRISNCHVHVKTAGTSWLEALRVVARANPNLYRRAHRFALANRAKAEQYYHVSTDSNTIPNIDLESDEYLVEYLSIPASRQTMHITYGILLNEDWFRNAFFACLHTHENDYQAELVRHIGKHLSLLVSGKMKIEA
jgi:hypothetical protein